MSLAKKDKKNSKVKQLEQLVKELNNNNEVLSRQVTELSKGKKLHVHDFYGNHLKYGILSDTHSGSLYSSWDRVHMAYKIAKKEGIEVMYHCGDIVDGEGNYRGQHYEQYVCGFERQAQDVVDNYPNNGIHTYFIEGNHSFKKISGAEVGRVIADRRKDMTFLGECEADIIVGGKYKAKLRIMHPDGGTGYALSYKMQKIVEAFTGGEKPNILAVGHYHKAEYIPNHRNVYALQAGCTQAQTPFMKRKHTPAHMGFWILDFHVVKTGVSQMNAKFIPFYG